MFLMVQQSTMAAWAEKGRMETQASYELGEMVAAGSLREGSRIWAAGQGSGAVVSIERQRQGDVEQVRWSGSMEWLDGMAQ